MIFPAIPVIILAMLAYMFWLAVFRMRRDRIAIAREKIRARLRARRARRDRRRDARRRMAATSSSRAAGQARLRR